MKPTRREWAACLAGAALACRSGSPPETSAEPTPDEEGGNDVLSRSYVLDLHCDTPMLMWTEGYDLGIEHDYGQVDIPRMRKGGVTGVFFSIYTSPVRNTEPQASAKAFEIIELVRRETARFSQDLLPATSAADIEKAKASGKIAVLMGVEGGHMLNGSIDVLRELYRRGSRYLTLTHSRDTAWAGSSGSQANRGLSEFGREIVAEMNRLGMMVDLSHVSDKTFFDAMETTRAPAIASHSSARALAAHGRNMTDEMIRAVAEQGGVMHVNYYNGFLDDGYAARSRQWSRGKESEADIMRKHQADPAAAGRAVRERSAAKLAAIGRPPLAVLLNHFAHAAKIGGVEAVGMGSDFDGVSDELPEGMEDISKIPNLVAGLSQRGFSDDDIEKILGGNTLRVMRAVEAAAG